MKEFRVVYWCEDGSEDYLEFDTMELAQNFMTAWMDKPLSKDGFQSLVPMWIYGIKSLSTERRGHGRIKYTN